MKNRFSEKKECTDKDVDGEFLARIICVEPEGRLILEDEQHARRAYMFKEVEYLLR